MTTIEHLKAARALIEKGWTQDAFARDKHLKPTLPGSKQATSWCILGAIEASEPATSTNLQSVNIIYDIIGGDSVSKWNDTPGRTQSDVLALFDKAIELEESKGGHNE